MEIDLVYLWVDGGDPAWQAKKRAATGESRPQESETDGKARYANHDELRYALRSAERFAPWIRKIFIVTDDQIPAWLDTSNPRVEVVDHRAIFPPGVSPCFNSSVIEYFLYKIPGLAPRFLFANDDMFFGGPVSPDFFFGSDGYPVLRLKKRGFGKFRYVVKRLLGAGFGHYRQLVYRSALLVEKRCGRFYSGIPHHNIDAYLRDDYRKAVEEIFRGEVERSQVHRTRTDGDFHRSAIALWTLAEGRAHLHYIGRGESLRIPVHNPDFAERLRRYSPSLLCLNDDQHAAEADRARIEPFLESLFPEKSAFEK